LVEDGGGWGRLYGDRINLHHPPPSSTNLHNRLLGQGHIADHQLAGRLDQTIAGLMHLAVAATHYPCAKTAWVDNAEAPPRRYQPPRWYEPDC
jgi:hypothetical protein